MGRYEDDKSKVQYDALVHEFYKINDWAMKSAMELWDTLKIYLQIVGILLALEGYILAEYTLPLLSSSNYKSAVSSVFVLWFLALVIIIFGWHTRRMIIRSYKRFLEKIAVIVMIRDKLKLIDQGIYPEDWVNIWKEYLLNIKHKEKFKGFINYHMNRTDTACSQMIILTWLIDFTTLSIALILTGFILCNYLFHQL